MIVQLIFAPIIISGLLVMPSYFFIKCKDFNLKPIEYQGFDMKRAGAICMCVAFLGVASIVVSTFLICEGGNFVVGVQVFFVLFSMLFNVIYYNRSAEVIHHTIEEPKWYVFEPDIYDPQYIYRIQDWGIFYSMCTCDNCSFDMVTECISEEYDKKYNDYRESGEIIYIYGIVVNSLVTLTILFDFKSLIIFFILAILFSQFALPVYVTAVYNRNLPKLFISIYGGAKYIDKILPVSWIAGVLLILTVIILVFKKSFVLFSFVPYVFCEIGIIIIIFKLRPSDSMFYLMLIWDDIQGLAIPHCIFLGLGALSLIIGFLCLACCGGGGGSGSGSGGGVRRLKAILVWESL